MSGFDVEKSTARATQLFEEAVVTGYTQIHAFAKKTYISGFVQGQRELYTYEYDGDCPCIGDSHQTHCRYYQGTGGIDYMIIDDLFVDEPVTEERKVQVRKWYTEEICQCRGLSHQLDCRYYVLPL